ILLVDPQGLIRWALPRLKERRFDVAVACSAEEAISMMLPGACAYQVVVVDLHMPRMSGTEFCRLVRARDCEAGDLLGGGGGAGGGAEVAVRPADCPKLLLHTTAAGSVKSDELEAFLEEGLVEKYVPHPLDITTLFDFLKLFEEDDDQYGTRKLSALLAQQSSATPLEGPGDAVGFVPAASRLVRTMTDTIGRTPRNAAADDAAAAERERGGADDASRGSKWWFGSRTPPPPTVQDVASTFFSGAAGNVESTASGAASAGKQRNGGAKRQAPASRTAGPWRPGPAAVSPGLGGEERGGGGGS
ncbi:unnamed protein product, partial [Laminaria digitata]